MTTLAINIALLPPEDIMEQCRLINSQLYEQNHDGFRFDETHLPHISLVQQYIASQALADITQSISPAISGIRSISCEGTDIRSEPLDGNLFIADFNIQPSRALENLQQVLLTLTRPFAAPGEASSFYDPEGKGVRDQSLRWTQNFINTSSHRPHITLGIGKPRPIVQPFSFIASRLALCHLGNFNTCRKILKEWELQPR